MTPHFVRFCRALALLSGASTLPAVVIAASASFAGGCSSTSSGVTALEDASSDAAGDTHGAYDGTVVGVAPCDGGCGITLDTGPDSTFTGDAMGTMPPPSDGGVDTNPDVPAGGPGVAPDLPFLA